MKKLLKYSNWVILLLLIITVTLTGCNEPEIEEEPENIIDHISYTILEDIYQAEVHIFKSNIKGPKVAIVGGIHGDEVAGWKTAYDLLERDDFTGEVMIIPNANNLAVSLELRYPGAGNSGIYQGITYSDVNRVFPGKDDGTITEKIAKAIIDEIALFEPLYIIDLHESKGSYSEGQRWIGDELIYSNKKSALFVTEIVDQFNELYLGEEDVPFAADSNSPEGSFNNYCGNYFDAYVFTIETNRNLDLSKRIEQQKQIIDLFFNLIKD